MSEIEEGILVDDWKTHMANLLSIDKSRINYISYEGASLVVTMNIVDNGTDSIDELFALIESRYSEIASIYPFVYRREV